MDRRQREARACVLGWNQTWWGMKIVFPISLMLGVFSGLAFSQDGALSKADADTITNELIEKHAVMIRESRAGEMKAKVIELDGKSMPFFYKVFGDKPEGGRSLFISMHGGGGAPKEVNDSQWENQKRLYQPEEGIYFVPRAPTDTWNLWHEGHIDDFYDRVIEDLIVFEGLNPNRVYIMGYSAGGDGVYQLAPRMADRLAAAAMMAGHPNEAKPLGLRNIGFTAHCGAEDAGFKRNEIIVEWGKQLDALEKGDPAGYKHHVEVHPGRGHWMNLEDKVAVPWMAKFTRNPFPEKIVWYQDDVAHDRFYWLALPKGDAKGGQEVIASRKGQEITIEKTIGVRNLIVLLNDTMLDLDLPVKILSGEKVLFEGKVARNRAVIERTLSERGDPASVFSAEVRVEL